MTLRIVGAVALLVSAAVHLYLWFDGVRHQSVGPMFLVNVVSGVVIAVLLLAGCHRAADTPAPMLTLWPAAMRVTGPSAKLDEHTLCFVAGTKAEATVFMHEPTATIILVKFTSTPDTPPALVVALGANDVAADTVRNTRAETSAYRATGVGRGEQVLSLTVPASSSPAAVLCVQQVMMTQP